MQITPLKTPIVKAGSTELLQLLDNAIADCPEGSVLAITSKIVSLCENRVAPIDSVDKDKLAIQESEQYLPGSHNPYGFYFSIAHNTLTPMAGIDESNSGGYYVLWPSDPQTTANQVRDYLAGRFGLKRVGVLITDSSCQPLRWGMTGIALAHSGFKALRDYRGEPDLFGRDLAVTQGSISGGLAAAAVLTMGEGAESTPLCLLSDLPFVEFQDRNPSDGELQALRIKPEEDLYGPFLTAAPWQRGGAWKE